MKRETKYLVAKRNDGKYLYLEEDVSTTSPRYVDSPLDAKLIDVYDDEEDLKHPKHPEWYFEHSHRMQLWLKDCRMVVITENREIIEEPIVGPTYEEVEKKLLPKWYKYQPNS